MICKNISPITEKATSRLGHVSTSIVGIEFCTFRHANPTFGQHAHSPPDNKDSPSSPVHPGPPPVLSWGHVQPRPDMDTVLVTDAQAHIQCPAGVLRLRQVHAGGGRARRGGAVQGVHGAGPVHPAQDNPHLQHGGGHGPHRTAVLRPGHHHDRFPFGQGRGLRQEGQVAEGAWSSS